LDKYYSGITTESAEVRLEKHNSGAYGKRFTSAATDWTIQLEITAVDYPHAILLIKANKNGYSDQNNILWCGTGMYYD